MLLSRLFPNKHLTTDVDATGLCENSRDAFGGAVFFAHVGSKSNGITYITDAITNGCVAVVVPETVSDMPPIPDHIPVITVANTRVEISRCASLFYPHRPETIMAVTGTSGKTSTTFFAQQIFNALSYSAVSIGTIGIAGAFHAEGTLTTPEAPELHHTLSMLAEKNVTHVMMEASSQALHQHRLDHVPLKAAAFTNLSRDHLDYHGDMALYYAAKERLFSELLPTNGVAVLNADDDYFADLQETCAARGIRVISYGRAGTDITLNKQDMAPHGQTLHLSVNGVSFTVQVAVGGAFQGHNIMAAIGLALAAGHDVATILHATRDLQAPPGRLEAIPGHPKGAAVYVDYAHKPDALENVLTSLREHTAGRLVCVFGCGGDRDPGKRAVMGEIAARLADVVIVTDDNPRSETPATIRAAILAHAPGARDIADRAEAIHTAIAELQTGDVLVVAGKGHEQGQKFNYHTLPFDDVTVCRDAIAHLSSPSSTTSPFSPSSLQGH